MFATQISRSDYRIKSMGAVNGCCIAIKFKINHSRFFRNMEKTEYVLNVCQLDGES